MSAGEHEVAFAFLDGLGLSSSRAPALTSVFQRCIRRELPAGEELCREGDAGKELYFITAGALAVRKKDHLGEPRDLAVMRAPAMIGHMGLVDGARRSASCEATEACVVLLMGDALYREIVGRRGDEGELLREMIISSMVQQLHRASTELAELVDRMPAANTLGRDAEVSGLLTGFKR